MSIINNEASATYTFAGDGSQLTSSSNNHAVELVLEGGLVLTKSASPTSFVAGDIITYTLNITNNSGSFLTGVRIVDNLGGGNLAYVVGSGSLKTLSTTYPVTPSATNPLTFVLQELNVGQTMTLTYKAQVIFSLPASVSTITNSVSGTGYTSSGTIEGSSSSSITKRATMSLSIAKTSSLSTVMPNQSFDYVLTLNNPNSAASTLVSIVDQLDPSFALASVSVKIGASLPVTLTSGDYTFTSGKLLTITKVGGQPIIIPATTSAVVTITGSFAS